VSSQAREPDIGISRGRHTTGALTDEKEKKESQGKRFEKDRAEMDAQLVAEIVRARLGGEIREV
jgi:hypothetical protein